MVQLYKTAKVCILMLHVNTTHYKGQILRSQGASPNKRQEYDYYCSLLNLSNDIMIKHKFKKANR